MLPSVWMCVCKLCTDITCRFCAEIQFSLSRDEHSFAIHCIPHSFLFKPYYNPLVAMHNSFSAEQKKVVPWQQKGAICKSLKQWNQNEMRHANLIAIMSKRWQIWHDLNFRQREKKKKKNALERTLEREI